MKKFLFSYALLVLPTLTVPMKTAELYVISVLSFYSLFRS